MVSDEDAERAAMKLKKRIEKSIKNARKLVGGATTQSKYGSMPSASSIGNSYQVSDKPLYQTTPKTSQVTVKHKTARQYDPDLVLRLKAKLGISHCPEEVKEAP